MAKKGDNLSKTLHFHPNHAGNIRNMGRVLEKARRAIEMIYVVRQGRITFSLL
jgi:hypothetical protein